MTRNADGVAAHRSPPPRHDIDALARERYPREPAHDPAAALDAICNRLSGEGRGRQAFALRAVVHANPRCGEQVADLVGDLIDVRDEYELRLLDLRVALIRRQEATP